MERQRLPELNQIALPISDERLPDMLAFNNICLPAEVDSARRKEGPLCSSHQRNRAPAIRILPVILPSTFRGV